MRPPCSATGAGWNAANAPRFDVLRERRRVPLEPAPAARTRRNPALVSLSKPVRRRVHPWGIRHRGGQSSMGPRRGTADWPCGAICARVIAGGPAPGEAAAMAISPISRWRFSSGPPELVAANGTIGVRAPRQACDCGLCRNRPFGGRRANDRARGGRSRQRPTRRIRRDDLPAGAGRQPRSSPRGSPRPAPARVRGFARPAPETAARGTVAPVR